jgi:hypothetical protein
MTKIQPATPDQGGGPRNTNPQSRYAFPEANPYARLAGPPKLQFGEQGELTHKTIEQAGLTGEEKKRAQEMLKVQAAYLAIYGCLDYCNDPDGHVVDLSGVHMTQPKVAIAWTLALAGFRPSGRCYIKKRAVLAPGTVEGAYTWVDSRAPDDAAQELRPEHSAADHHLPPDTRRLAAIRDGAPGQQLPNGWHVKPKIVWEDVPREQRGNPKTPPPADTIGAP